MKKETTKKTVSPVRDLLKMFVMLGVLSVIVNPVSASQEIGGNLHAIVIDNDNRLHHTIQRRSIFKSIGNLQITRDGSSSITVAHNGRTLHYHGRGIVNGMLQEFFGAHPPAPGPSTSISDPSFSVSNSQARPLSSSSYTSARERSKYTRQESPNTDSNSRDIPDSNTSASAHPSSNDVTGEAVKDPRLMNSYAPKNSVVRPSVVSQPPSSIPSQSRSSVAPQRSTFVARQPQQTAKPNYWAEVGHGRAPPPPLPRKPSYVEYFTMMRIPGSGQRFSGYAFNIKNEDRLLFPQYGQHHLKAPPGLAMNPWSSSDYHGPNKTLEFISEAIISGMHAQYFGVKNHRIM